MDLCINHYTAVFEMEILVESSNLVLEQTVGKITSIIHSIIQSYPDKINMRVLSY